MPEPLRVLMIEDSEDDALLIARELKKGGLDAECSRVDTQEALCAALERSWALVLCDYSMPRFSGIKALQIVRERDANVPVIFVSGMMGEDVAVAAMRAGANDYLIKDNLMRLVPAVQRELRDATVRSERKRAEEALCQAAEEIRDLYNHAPCGYQSLDKDGVIIRVNDTQLEWLGYEREELIGKVKFADLLTPESLDIFEKNFPRFKASGVVRDLQLGLVRRDSSVLPVVLSSTAVTDRDGNYVMSRSTIYDLTELKRVEETLRKLSRAVEQSPTSILITDAKGNIEYVNPKFVAVTGYSPADVLGKNPRLLKSGETPAEVYRELWETISSGKEWRGEFHSRKKNGELFWERVSISPLLDAAGSITHFIAVKEDFTEHKRLEEEFRQVQKLEAVGQLAGGVAHDFNNILQAILMNLSLLKDEPGLTPDTLEGLQELENDANRAASLTRQLLLFSRRQALDVRPLDLNDIVTGLTKMLRRLIGEDIELVFQGQGTSMLVMADSGTMDQVLMNLCVNARDAMPQGGRLTIGTRRIVLDAESVRTQPEAYPGAFICLSVTDTGCGIERQTLEHMFEPFFTTKEVGQGTGLGLATVYGIVKQHRGWIVVESAVGKGTTFQVYLPALEDALVHESSSSLANLRGGSETILLVEDDKILCRLTALNLRKLGYAVLEAADGAESSRIWDQHQSRIDLLLTDVVMPGNITGIDLAEQFMKDKPRLAVLVVSGYGAEKSKPEGLAARGISFLAKPYSIADLADMVRSCLNRCSDRVPQA